MSADDLLSVFQCACGERLTEERDVWAHLDRFHGGRGFVLEYEDYGDSALATQPATTNAKATP
jgi:hypothetical protein